MTDLLSPLTALVREGQSNQFLERGIARLASPAGIFSVRARTVEPIGGHDIDLVFTSVEEEELFRAWFHDHLGALVPFWLPSYHQDLVLAQPIDAADTDIVIQWIDYTARFFPSDNRKVLAFVRADGTMLKRDVEASVDNGDGTETLTLNAALGEDWEQTYANGICFCWYGRLDDDVVEYQWQNHEICLVTVKMTELRNPPLGGSATAGPITGEFPDP